MTRTPVAKIVALAIVPEAHVACMLGRRFWWTGNSQCHLWKAASHFEQSIDLGPEWARPYCGLVDTLCVLSSRGALKPHEIRDEMEARIDRALALDG